MWQVFFVISVQDSNNTTVLAMLVNCMVYVEDFFMTVSTMRSCITYVTKKKTLLPFSPPPPSELHPFPLPLFLNCDVALFPSPSSWAVLLSIRERGFLFCAHTFESRLRGKKSITSTRDWTHGLCSATTLPYQLHQVLLSNIVRKKVSPPPGMEPMAYALALTTPSTFEPHCATTLPYQLHQSDFTSPFTPRGKGSCLILYPHRFIHVSCIMLIVSLIYKYYIPTLFSKSTCLKFCAKCRYVIFIN